MTMTFYVEIALEVLLAATLVYCIILERRLAAVRKGQEGLSAAPSANSTWRSPAPAPACAR